MPSFDGGNSAPAFNQPASEPQPSFDMFGGNAGQQASAPQSIPEVPYTNPIQETPSEEFNASVGNSTNLFSFGPTSSETNFNSAQPAPQQPQNSVPEPIIITDYTKQYDPIMPQTENVPISKVDFKEVIAAIRECSSKIESYGYRIDVEEYDLTNLYQVVFKIDK